MAALAKNSGPERGRSIYDLSSVKRPCWSCSSEVVDPYSCSRCEVIQEFLKETDYFSCFEIGYRLNIDLSMLEKQYYTLSRKFHPDYYQQKSSEEQGISLENTALLNKAYRTLKDPQKRASYLIGLIEGDQSLETKAPSDLFEEIFEVQEILEEIRGLSASDTDERSRLIGDLEDAYQRMQRYKEAGLKSLYALFPTWDSLEETKQGQGFGEEQRTCLREIKQVLSHTGYLDRIIRNIKEAISDQ